MYPNIKLKLGVGASIDGGPCFACEVYDCDYSTVVLDPDEGERFELSAEDLQDALRDEIESGEPIRVSSTPMDDHGPSIKLPIHDDVNVVLHAPVDFDNQTYFEGEELEETRIQWNIDYFGATYTNER